MVLVACALVHLDAPTRHRLDELVECVLRDAIPFSEDASLERNDVVVLLSVYVHTTRRDCPQILNWIEIRRPHRPVQ